MTFRPAYGFTGFCVFALSILVGMGMWQLERLEWKEQLIRSAHEGLAADPIDLSIWEVLVPVSESMRYNKVTARGKLDTSKILYLYATGPSGPGYNVISPFHMEGQGVVLVDRGFVSEVGQVEGRSSEPVVGQVTGIIQLDGKGTLGVEGNGAGGIWTYRSALEMGAQLGFDVVHPFTVVLLPNESETPTAGQPRPMAPHLEFANNHLSYAITWFGLAFALICVYIAFHKSQGRLTFGGRAQKKE